MRLSGKIFSMGPDKPAMLGPGRRQAGWRLNIVQKEGH
jgi:hypothetical protein